MLSRILSDCLFFGANDRPKYNRDSTTETTHGVIIATTPSEFGMSETPIWSIDSSTFTIEAPICAFLLKFLSSTIVMPNRTLSRTFYPKRLPVPGSKMGDDIPKLPVKWN